MIYNLGRATPHVPQIGYLFDFARYPLAEAQDKSSLLVANSMCVVYEVLKARSGFQVQAGVGPGEG